MSIQRRIYQNRIRLNEATPSDDSVISPAPLDPPSGGLPPKPETKQPMSCEEWESLVQSFKRWLDHIDAEIDALFEMLQWHIENCDPQALWDACAGVCEQHPLGDHFSPFGCQQLCVLQRTMKCNDYLDMIERRLRWNQENRSFIINMLKEYLYGDDFSQCWTDYITRGPNGGGNGGGNGISKLPKFPKDDFTGIRVTV